MAASKKQAQRKSVSAQAEPDSRESGHQIRNFFLQLVLSPSVGSVLMLMVFGALFAFGLKGCLFSAQVEDGQQVPTGARGLFAKFLGGPLHGGAPSTAGPGSAAVPLPGRGAVEPAAAAGESGTVGVASGAVALTAPVDAQGGPGVVSTSSWPAQCVGAVGLVAAGAACGWFCGKHPGEQVLDGEKTRHRSFAAVNNTPSPGDFPDTPWTDKTFLDSHQSQLSTLSEESGLSYGVSASTPATVCTVRQVIGSGSPANRPAFAIDLNGKKCHLDQGPLSGRSEASTCCPSSQSSPRRTPRLMTPREYTELDAGSSSNHDVTADVAREPATQVFDISRGDCVWPIESEYGQVEVNQVEPEALRTDCSDTASDGDSSCTFGPECVDEETMGLRRRRRKVVDAKRVEVSGGANMETARSASSSDEQSSSDIESCLIHGASQVPPHHKPTRQPAVALGLWTTSNSARMSVPAHGTDSTQCPSAQSSPVHTPRLSTPLGESCAWGDSSHSADIEGCGWQPCERGISEDSAAGGSDVPEPVVQTWSLSSKRCAAEHHDEGPDITSQYAALGLFAFARETRDESKDDCMRGSQLDEALQPDCSDTSSDGDSDLMSAPATKRTDSMQCPSSQSSPVCTPRLSTPLDGVIESGVRSSPEDSVVNLPESSHSADIDGASDTSEDSEGFVLAPKTGIEPECEDLDAFDSNGSGVSCGVGVQQDTSWVDRSASEPAAVSRDPSVSENLGYARHHCADVSVRVALRGTPDVPSVGPALVPAPSSPTSDAANVLSNDSGSGPSLDSGDWEMI